MAKVSERALGSDRRSSNPLCAFGIESRAWPKSGSRMDSDGLGLDLVGQGWTGLDQLAAWPSHVNMIPLSPGPAGGRAGAAASRSGEILLLQLC